MTVMIHRDYDEYENMTLLLRTANTYDGNGKLVASVLRDNTPAQSNSGEPREQANIRTGIQKFRDDNPLLSWLP